ncbi:hypothetical protein FHR83_006159 [Actinoplanes campanulatus]|uniref:Uncharacterized protein n=1 Tax=Actinoplanes campanulatus TaxID=113559 RepID=A0A7W5ALR0_9ACTN|nr:hypothetical protein [Actinoplanes campanulatus]MBB3098460.1 hypothetical protein [Actinoplanes campanulatus]GGN35331.1 hypothetical protein GCM10010109_59290 [Actinoplanes campanulatus]GID39153.1 hypothetical protein Aca09nite_56590 [Actinoplanes campanulatus]
MKTLRAQRIRVPTVVLALFKARDLTLSLDRARDLTLDLDLDLDLDPARDLASGLYRVLVLARVRARVRDRDLVRAHDLIHAHDIARDVARALDLDRARNRAGARARACHLDLDRLWDLIEAIDAARCTAKALVADLAACVPAGQEAASGPVRPARMAARLTRGAARVLPAGARSRYADEFASELYELAAAGASRAAQVIYGLRLFDRAWVLRAELRAAVVRGKAARP